MLDELADAHRQKTRSFEKPPAMPWLDPNLIERLDALRRLVDAFNQASRRYPDRVPPTIRWMLEKARAKDFHDAFDDSRIPASIRLAYHAHHGLFFHRIALHQVYMGRLPAASAHPVREALEIDLRRALGLAMGMPGAEHVRDSLDASLVDVEPLDIREEEQRWQGYTSSNRMGVLRPTIFS